VSRSWSSRLGAALVAAIGLLTPGIASGQQPDSAAAARPPAPVDSMARADTLPEAPETSFSVDTIVVVADRKGLVWGDWYVNPEVGQQVAQAIQRKGQLSGRTWLQAAAPIQSLALGRPAGDTQLLSFVDKGEALNFWKAGEVEYSYVFDGPFGLRARGTARSGTAGATAHLVRIPLPVRQPPERDVIDERARVGRVDITYKPASSRADGPRGRFSVYLYYLNPELGYRIVGVGY
jgi:hypothetical protein